MARILDIVFAIYFLMHIPISFLIDTQAVIPSKYFPKQMIDIKQWYCNMFRDPLIADPPVWFQSVMCCELLLQFPFFFVAAYGYFKGAAKCKWLKIPAIIYGSHAATSMVCLLAHVLFADFSSAKYPVPRNMEERLTLAGAYSLFFIMPVVILLDATLNSAYSTSNVKHTKSSASSASKVKNTNPQNVPSQRGQSKKKKAN